MPNRTILVAEDEDLFRQSVSESLRARFPGVNVIEAEDGAAAREVLEKAAVDVILTDLRMPKLGGIELVAWVANRRAPIQVIVMSAHASDETRGFLRDLGALVCLDKPIDIPTLYSAVQRMLAVPRAHVSGVTLAGFVQLLEAERRTCGLRVAGPQQTGVLVIHAGMVVDASFQGIQGEEAAIAILQMQDYKLDLIGAMPESEHRIRKSLSFLLLEAARRTDETELVEAPPEWDDAAGPFASNQNSAESLNTSPNRLIAKPSTRPPTDPNLRRSARPPTRPPTDPTTRPSARPPTRPSTEPATRVANRPSSRPVTGPPVRRLSPSSPSLPAVTAPEPALTSLRNQFAKALAAEGAISVALVDLESGHVVARLGGADADFEAVSAGGSALIRAKRHVLKLLGLPEEIEDVVVATTTEYHVIRPLLGTKKPAFIYLVIDRAHGNLALARHMVAQIGISGDG